VHQVELIHQPALLQHLQRAVHRHAVQLRVLLARHLEQCFGVEVFAGLVDQLEQDPKLNRVTVYRTLKMLKQGGLVDELDLMHLGGDQHYYETRMKQEHAHVICLRCGKVEEFFGEPLQRLRRQVEQNLGFNVLIARTEIGGYCVNCQSQRLREMAEVAAGPNSEPNTGEHIQPRQRKG
jgi:Fe2+ or Zn2+ uptake regulation protein